MDDSSDGNTKEKQSTFSPFIRETVDEVRVADNGNGREKSLWMLCRDKQYRRKLFHSFCLASSLFCVWLVETQPGATFLDLQIITRTGFEEASKFFTIHTVGFMIGCVLAGILPKKIRVNILMSVGLFAMGACAIATPFCSSYGLMMAVRWLSGIFPGTVESVIYAEQMRIWRDEGKSVTQLTLLLASIGLFLAPIISEPFLAAKRNQTTDREQGHNDYTFHLETDGPDLNISGTISKIDEQWNHKNNLSVNDSLGHFHVDSEVIYPTTNVFYAFLISGGLSILISLLILVFYRPRRKESETVVKVKIDEEVKYRNIPSFLKVNLIVCICLFNLFISTAGVSFVSFLMTFLVKQYDHITKSESAYFITLFFCSGSGARIMLIFLADRISAKYLLGIFVLLSFISFVSFSVTAIFGNTAILVVLIGVSNMGLAPVLPLTLSWCQADYLEVSNVLSSSLTFSVALGVMANPMLLAFLMENKGNIWFCYLHTIEAFIAVLFLIFMFLINGIYVNPKYGPLNIPEEKKDLDDDKDDLMTYSLKIKS